MCEKTRNGSVHLFEKDRRAKGGFTLTELCIVLALSAVITAMIVSFAVMMNKHAEDVRNEYDFVEDCATVKNSVCDWAAELDTDGHEFFVSEDVISVKNGGTAYEVSFYNDRLLMGSETVKNLESIEKISFETNGRLIKCIVYGADTDSEKITEFVFSLRCASITAE